MVVEHLLDSPCRDLSMWSFSEHSHKVAALENHIKKEACLDLYDRVGSWYSQIGVPWILLSVDVVFPERKEPYPILGAFLSEITSPLHVLFHEIGYLAVGQKWLGQW